MNPMLFPDRKKKAMLQTYAHGEIFKTTAEKKNKGRNPSEQQV
jgi:hypothetical protein